MPARTRKINQDDFHGTKAWEWCKAQSAKPTVSPTEKAALERLITDARMEPVFNRFESLESQKHYAFQVDRAILFFKIAAVLPGKWQSFQNKAPDHRNTDKRNLAEICHSAATILNAERDFIQYRYVLDLLGPTMDLQDALSDVDEAEIWKPEFFESARRRLADLTAELNTLEKFAETSIFNAPVKAAYYDIPKKKSLKRASCAEEELFCMRRMLRSTWHFFDEPLCSEIATTLTVVLGRPITRTRVNSTWKEIKDADFTLRTDIAIHRKKMRGEWPQETVNKDHY